MNGRIPGHLTAAVELRGLAAYRTAKRGNRDSRGLQVNR
jgi:hypothetical protein